MIQAGKSHIADRFGSAEAPVLMRLSKDAVFAGDMMTSAYTPHVCLYHVCLRHASNMFVDSFCITTLTGCNEQPRLRQAVFCMM